MIPGYAWSPRPIWRHRPWKPKEAQFLKASALKPSVRTARAAFRDDLERRFVTKLPSARKETLRLRMAAASKTPDYLGDTACNSGEHPTRHHATKTARGASREARLHPSEVTARGENPETGKP